MNKEYERRIKIAVEAASDFFGEFDRTKNLNMLDDDKCREINELYFKALDVGTPGSEENVDLYYQISRFWLYRALIKLQEGGLLEEAFGERKTLTRAELAPIYYELTSHLDDVIKDDREKKNRDAYIEQKKWIIDEFNENLEQRGYTIIQKNGCYIATAVYGSYDCPQVWILRRYRDNYLARHFLGQIFIRLYYSVSPHFVKWFGDKKWFNCLFHKPLDLFVNNLYRRGYADTPYQDLCLRTLDTNSSCIKNVRGKEN